MSQNYRKYTIIDARLLEHGSVVEASLAKDLNDFFSFDRTINQGFISRLHDAIEACYQIKPDHVVKYQLAQLTGKVNRKMEACNNVYDTISYFVKKVFKDNLSVQNQFGLNGPGKPGNNHSRMIIFMGSLAKTAAIYRDRLVEGGINPEVINALPRLQEELYEAKNNQEMFKKERGKITYERVKRMNALYDMLKAISDISRIIYADNPARLKKYLMPARRPSGRSRGEQTAS